MSDATGFDSSQELRDNARGVMKGPAFARWKEIVSGQIDGRMRAAVTPIKTVDDALERNYANGETAGLMQALQLWDLMVEEATAEIQDQPE